MPTHAQDPGLGAGRDLGERKPVPQHREGAPGKRVFNCSWRPSASEALCPPLVASSSITPIAICS